MFLTSISYIMPLFIPSPYTQIAFSSYDFYVHCVMWKNQASLVVIIDIMYTLINLTELHTKSETNQIDII